MDSSQKPHSAIDELPLDLFGDKRADAASAPAAPLDGPSPGQQPSPAAAIAAGAETTGEPSARTRKFYDAIGMVGIAVALGLVLRLFRADALMPVVNIVLAVVIFRQLPVETRERVHGWLDGLRRQVEPRRLELRHAPVPDLTSERRWAYDAAGVVACWTACWFMFVLIGADQWLVVPWLVTLVAGAIAYFVPLKPYRHEYYVFADRVRVRLAGAEPNRR